MLLSNEEVVQPDYDLGCENFPKQLHDYNFASIKLHTETKINLTILVINHKVVSQIISKKNGEYEKKLRASI
jgi:hypothetical protein